MGKFKNCLIFIYLFILKQESEKTTGKKNLVKLSMFLISVACTLENVINQGCFEALQGTSLHWSDQYSGAEWVVLIVFSFISTYLLEVFRLDGFQRALVELCVCCHDFFFFF